MVNKEKQAVQTLSGAVQFLPTVEARGLLSHLWKVGSFSVAGPAKPLNLTGDSSGPLIRNHNANNWRWRDMHQA
jgi:hypothetical protein